MSEFRSGFVAIGGRPNVGKSTLLNALIGQKLAIVTPRPQTTRHRLIGLAQLPEAQIAYVDTPGLHSGPRRALNRAMNRTAAAALSDADLILLVVEALRFTDEDELALSRVRDAHRPTFAVINKVDRVHPRARLLPFLGELAERFAFQEVVPVSALRGANIESLRALVVAALPVGPALFPSDQLTDRSIEFRITEIIREKLTLELTAELPYGIAVELEADAMQEDGRRAISAVIWVDRDGQKPIVIGADGSRLKRVGRAARLELNTLLGERVHLNLWVKVREDWADDARALAQLGLE